MHYMGRFFCSLVIVTSLASCATTNDLKSLSDRVASNTSILEQVEGDAVMLKRQMKLLQKEWGDFKTHYHEGLHASLQKNLDLSAKYRIKTKKYMAEAGGDREMVRVYKKESRENLVVINDNMDRAQVKNIANEFEKLQSDFSELGDAYRYFLVDIERDVGNMQLSVRASREYAESSKNYSQQSLSNINDSIKRFNKSAKWFHNQAATIDNINRDLNKLKQRVKWFSKHRDEVKMNSPVYLDNH